MRHAPQALKVLFCDTHEGFLPVDQLYLAKGSPLHTILGYIGFASPNNQAMRSLILAPRFPESNHRHKRPRPSIIRLRFPNGNNINSVTSSKAQGYSILYIISIRFALINKTGG